MPKHKAIGIQSKPEVDQEKLDLMKQEEEDNVEEINKKLAEEDQEEEQEEKPKKTPVDYETKFKESQKEALVLKAQLEQIEAEKQKKVEITEDYLKGKYTDWEDMTAGEQRAIKKAEELEQEVQEIKNNANQFNNDRKWQEKVDSFVTEDLADQFPKLVGREEEFARFATRPTRKGLPLDDLAKIFLFENPTQEKKRSLFHQPGAAGTPTPDDTMNADDVRILRTSKPLEYMRLVRAGKIKIKI